MLNTSREGLSVERSQGNLGPEKPSAGGFFTLPTVKGEGQG